MGKPRCRNDRLVVFVTDAGAVQSCRMKIIVHANGVVQLDGTAYSLREPERSRLKQRIESNFRRDRNCEYQLLADRDVPFKVLGGAALVLQEAGAGKIGFLTEPRNAP